MADKVIVTKTKLDALATSISEKSGVAAPMTIAQMKVAVDGIIAANITQDENGYLVLDEGESSSNYAENIATRTALSGRIVTKTDVGVAEYGFSYFPQITSVHITTPSLGGYCFQGSTNCSIFVGEGACAGNYNVFYNATGINTIDFSNQLTASFSNNYFRYSNLTNLILRNSSVVPLVATGAFNNTPFASGGTGGTLYVPSSLISSYTSANNWSTILGYENNQILPIEGSIYETQYADGTAIT